MQSCYLRFDEKGEPILSSWAAGRVFGVFHAEKTSHYFLIRESPDNKEAQTHNQMVLEELRNNLVQTVKVVGKNFFKEFLEHTEKLLPTYLKAKLLI